MRAPTKKQIKFAQDLGVDIPSGITRAALSRLISNAVKAQQEERCPHIPNELASIPGMQDIHPIRVQQIQRFRDSGIKAGCIVSCFHGLAVVLDSSAVDKLRLRVMLILTQRLYTNDSSSFQFVYAPPSSHVHPFLAAQKTNAASWSDHKKTILSFKVFAEKKLKPHQIYNNEHGIFWSKLAVAELWSQYLLELKKLADQKAEQNLSKKRAKEDRKNRVRYCSYCGSAKNKNDDFYRSSRCTDCQGMIAGEVLFCCRCGKQFVNENYSIKQNPKTTCPECVNNK